MKKKLDLPVLAGLKMFGSEKLKIVGNQPLVNWSVRLDLI
jgi:hypothetical protein